MKCQKSLFAASLHRGSWAIVVEPITFTFSKYFAAVGETIASLTLAGMISNGVYYKEFVFELWLYFEFISSTEKPRNNKPLSKKFTTIRNLIQIKLTSNKPENKCDLQGRFRFLAWSFFCRTNDCRAEIPLGPD